MPDPVAPEGVPKPSATWVASRLQARFEGLDADHASSGQDDLQPPSSGGIEPGAVRNAGMTAHGFPRTSDKAAQRQLDDLMKQLAVLRDQLDAAFDEFDQRLEGAETRAAVAEARASVAEARASVAETRATDAEARANLAHTRLDEVIEYLTEQREDEDDADLAEIDRAAIEHPATLRGALDRLRDRLDVG